MNNAESQIIDLAEHNDWFKDGEAGRKQFEAVFSDAFKGGNHMVPLVYEGKTIAFAMSPERTKEMMIDRIVERLREDSQLLLKIFRQTKKIKNSA